MLYLGLLILFAMLLSACGSTTTTTGGSGSTPSPAASTVAAPNDLITPGTMTVGSDTTYPPQEYIDTATKQATGFDIDLITAIAKQMGLQTKVVTTSFDTIINSLVAKRFDVVISAVTINPDRQKKVDFVPYFNAGESLLVKAGNPLNIKSTNDLCGQKVGVQNGTVEQTDLNTANTDCKKAGKPTIEITALTNQTDVIQLLVTSRVVATYQDSPVTDYYNKLHPGQFSVGGSVVNAAPEGIVVRKGDPPMFNAVQTAFNQLKTNGTYTALIQKWGLTNEAIS
jgi:polar amino acid transport system substrate-binding protein